VSAFFYSLATAHVFLYLGTLCKLGGGLTRRDASCGTFSFVRSVQCAIKDSEIQAHRTTSHKKNVPFLPPLQPPPLLSSPHLISCPPPSSSPCHLQYVDDVLNGDAAAAVAPRGGEPPHDGLAPRHSHIVVELACIWGGNVQMINGSVCRTRITFKQQQWEPKKTREEVNRRRAGGGRKGWSERQTDGGRARPTLNEVHGPLLSNGSLTF